MATIKEIVEDIYSGADETNPYRTLKTPLSELITIATSKGNGYFIDGTTQGTLASSITSYETNVTSLITDINDLISDLNSHFNDWWKEDPATDNFSSYRITPNVLRGGDNTRDKIYKESGLAPVSEQNTFFYKGRQTWATDVGNLDSWIGDVETEKINVDGITGGGTITDGSLITTASAIITAAKLVIQGINSSFNTLKNQERNAWDNAIRYNQAYSYARLLQGNKEDPVFQDLKDKFSGNLPEIPDPPQ